jgi:molybdopterin-binding protein
VWQFSANTDSANLDGFAHHQTAREGKVMKLSTRNIVKGKVLEVKEGMIMAKVKVDIGGGNIVTAIITDEALKELGVKVGEELAVLVKATSVMVAKDIR